MLHGAVSLLHACCNRRVPMSLSAMHPAEEKLKAFLEELKAAGIAYEAGKHTERVYDCALIVISPGVPSSAPVVLEAQKRGNKNYE